MRYGGKVEGQHRARELRAESWTLADIAAELGVAKSSVSRWVRDVDFEPNPRRTARKRGPNKLQRAKAAEIERFRIEGIERVGELTEREFLMAGLGLYAGDGSKTGNEVKFANSNPDLIRLFCAWFRTFFDIDEARLRIRLYLHEGLDLEAAVAHWSVVTNVASSQFTKPYRAPADATRRRAKHVHGCCHVCYASAPTHRAILGMLSALALVTYEPDPG
jgi:transcriptional regulator with XRE-family HTH domain